MAITYTVAEYAPEDKTVEVVYTNDEGFEHKRQINIPHNSDGSVDEGYLAEILEGQLRGVENKLRVGAVTFTDPSATTEVPEVPEEGPEVGGGEAPGEE